jgi:hypothetical protein
MAVVLRSVSPAVDRAWCPVPETSAKESVGSSSDLATNSNVQLVALANEAVARSRLFWCKAMPSRIGITVDIEEGIHKTLLEKISSTTSSEPLLQTVVTTDGRGLCIQELVIPWRAVSEYLGRTRDPTTRHKGTHISVLVRAHEMEQLETTRKQLPLVKKACIRPTMSDSACSPPPTPPDPLWARSLRKFKARNNICKLPGISSFVAAYAVDGSNDIRVISDLVRAYNAFPKRA